MAIRNFIRHFPLLLFITFVILIRTISSQIFTRRPEENIIGTPSTTPINFGNPRITGNDPNQIIVKTSLGDLAGKRLQIKKLSWTVDKDQRDKPPPDRRGGDEDFRFQLPAENDVTVYAFLGVPFAEAPVKSRRFNKPQKLTHFPRQAEPDQPYPATQFKAACPQSTEARPSLLFNQLYEYIVDEDCLYLNIFTPQVSRTGGKYPVILFFHGGGFQYGAANDWPGYVLASKGVVVVTANYRLGPFGFISLGDSTSGNYGLLDQQMAMQWCRDYIHNFNGDENRVTIVGHGAGGASVGLHMLSPFSTKLFRGAGAMSGADVSYEMVISKPALAFNNTIKLGRRVGCTEGTVNDVWACIQGRSTEDIIQGANSMFIEYNRYAFLPTVDRRLVPGNPTEHLKLAPTDSVWAVKSPVPYMIGVNANDGTATLLSNRDIPEFSNDWSQIDQQFMDRKILEFVVKRNYTTNAEAVMQAINYKYRFWPDVRSPRKARDMFIDFASDAYYVSPAALSARLHASAGSRVYMYVNAYNFSTGYTNEKDRFLPYWMGVCHECDLYLLFGFPWMPKEYLPQHFRDVIWTEHDRNASELFMTLWERFAATQNPNVPNDYINWPHLNPIEHWYLQFNYTKKRDGTRQDEIIDRGRKVLRDYKWQTVAFWNEYLTQLALLFTTTYSPTLATFRKELVGYKIATGTFIILTMLISVAAGSFAYMLFERQQRRRRRTLLSYENETPMRSIAPTPTPQYQNNPPVHHPMDTVPNRGYDGTRWDRKTNL